MQPKVVICGTFHRDLDGLKRTIRELEITGCRVLSPISVDFVETEQEIVRLPSEAEFSIHELEKYHLRAIYESDLVWLHTPDGHIGTSGAYELGFAKALNKPIFSRQIPTDQMLASQVRVVDSVFEALELTYFS